ncbi:HD domain-containing protein [Candidatus Spongiihabitans sp.]|uniref:HD domain-containing protein n=1 Tax=Candidatus Spongiihabitans sp. TaxID=3101308 RepID=UPI003C6F866B
MKTVAFAHMADGTAQEYAFLAEQEKLFVNGLPERLISALEALEHSFSGYRVSRLEHSLQSATHAYQAGESEQMVVAALLHDIGDTFAPVCHSEMAAAILRPYVSDRIYWIVGHHGLFQLYYYAHYFDRDRHARDRYKDHRWYQDTIDFCENYDQNCFDPDFKSKPMTFFKPMVERVFTEPLRHFV